MVDVYTISEPYTHFCECTRHLFPLHKHRRKFEVILCNAQTQDSDAKIQKVKISARFYLLTSGNHILLLSTPLILTQVLENSHIPPDLKIQVMQKVSLEATNMGYPPLAF